MCGQITLLLAEINNGNLAAVPELTSLVYDELHRTAARLMRRERPGHTLQTTALVNEAYLHLVAENDRTWQNRAHFFAAAAQLMRRILVDNARGKNALKRGGGQFQLQIQEAMVFSDNDCEQVLIIDQAMQRLAEFDDRMSRVVELKFFAGLTDEEIGMVLRISPRTVKRDWNVAKAWLRSELAATGK
jgi:RNA polymerase sigma-70 factor, ECF subfamily